MNQTDINCSQRPPRKHRMDLRGLTSAERQVGAVVKTGKGTYRVTEINTKTGTAVMELAKEATHEPRK